MKAGTGIVDVAGDRQIEDVAHRGLDAHGAHQDETGDVPRRHAGHLGGDPAAEAETDQGGLLQAEQVGEDRITLFRRHEA